jgi:LCP family protein required for cell wall assembly
MKLLQWIRKKPVILVLAGVAVGLLVWGGVWAAGAWHRVNHDQMGLFVQTPPKLETAGAAEPDETEPAGSATPTVQTESVTAEPTATPTLSPYDQLASQADQSIMQDTLNVLLIGVDYAQERVNNPKEYVGKNFNSDVMLLLAINFKQNKVDMISVPRDTYAKIANLKGIYKLNFALEAGGGMTDEGYMNVCKSVQGILGGIPVNYYIAVTMPVVKELTDAVGGVDYDMDLEYSIDGREYKKGVQHLNGQGVLDYCRVRKGDVARSEAGELNRVNRQKKMLLTVFKKLQSDSKILDVPKLLMSMQGKVFTNMNFEQLAAITVFGKDLPQANITMRTMPGAYINLIFKRSYVLLDQAKRVQMIKDVYGVSVPKQYKYSANNARLLWAYMQGMAWDKEIKTIQAKDAKLPTDKQKLTDAGLNQQLAEALSGTEAKLQFYQEKANGSAYVKLTEAQDLEKQVQGLYAIASSMFSHAGYKANWKVNVTTRGEPAMKE